MKVIHYWLPKLHLHHGVGNRRPAQLQPYCSGHCLFVSCYVQLSWRQNALYKLAIIITAICQRALWLANFYEKKWMVHRDGLCWRVQWRGQFHFSCKISVEFRASSSTLFKFRQCGDYSEQSKPYFEALTFAWQRCVLQREYFDFVCL